MIKGSLKARGSNRIKEIIIVDKEGVITKRTLKKKGDHISSPYEVIPAG